MTRVTIVRGTVLAAAVTGFISLASAAAVAREYALRNVGDWTVTASKDGKGCFLTREYEPNGGTTLLLGVDTDGTNRLSLLNPNWSIKPEDKLKLNFRLSNSSYPAHFAVGIASDGKRGFVTSFGTKFPSLFATSKTLDVSRGDVPVERLDLGDAKAAIRQLGKCVDEQRDAPADTETGTARSDGIPKDPFAPTTKSKPKRQ
jgi:hypothetical protein